MNTRQIQENGFISINALVKSFFPDMGVMYNDYNIKRVTRRLKIYKVDHTEFTEDMIEKINVELKAYNLFISKVKEDKWYAHVSLVYLKPFDIIQYRKDCIKYNNNYKIKD